MTALVKLLCKKKLVSIMCGENPERLHVRSFDVIHPEIKKKCKNIFFSSRSIQEPKDYVDADTFFQKKFEDADIAFISSHINPETNPKMDSKCKEDIKSIIENAKKRFYNVTGVFFSNSIEQDKSNNEDIALYDCDERLFLENPLIEETNPTKLEENAKKQLEEIAEYFGFFIVNRTSIS